LWHNHPESLRHAQRDYVVAANPNAARLTMAIMEGRC
jgi:hypothetical protein